MVTSINSASATRVAGELFARLDTANKGFVDQADLEAAAPAGQRDSAKALEQLKQIDGDGNGQISKSELSQAVDKVGATLDAQRDQARLQAGAAPAPAGGSGGSGRAPAAGGAPPAAATDSGDSTVKYNATADTDSDGTVSADEEAAYKKLLARAEEKAQQQLKAYGQDQQASVAGLTRAVDVSA